MCSPKVKIFFSSVDPLEFFCVSAVKNLFVLPLCKLKNFFMANRINRSLSV